MEQWKPIEGFEAYEVSDAGRVRRRLSGAGGTFVGRIITPHLISRYLSVKLHKDGKGSHLRLHRLVAKAFVPNPLNQPEVNHIHEPKTNCDASNLEWRSSAGNTQHAVITRLMHHVGVGGVAFNHRRPNSAKPWRMRYSPSPWKVIEKYYATAAEAILARKEAIAGLVIIP